MSEDTPFRHQADYVKQWKRNRQCCSTIDSQFRDWQVTVVFYTALQAVNAAAAKLGEKPSNHTDRNNLIKNNEVFAPLRQQYLLLYRLSRFTRYDPKSDNWLPKKYVTAQALVDDVLLPIERHVENILGTPLSLGNLTMKV